MEATQGSKRGIPIFFICILFLGVLRVFLQRLEVPLGVVPIANVLMCEIFLGIPLLALCYAAKDEWTPKTALMFLVGGVFTQLICVYLTKRVLHGPNVTADIVNAIGQVGLPVWCVGLGALLATLIKDKNLVVPIAIFLACFDMFLVFSPYGVTQMVIKQMPSVLPAIGAAIPVASATNPTTGRVAAGSFAGPADFMFLAMFMIALFRFNLQARRTVMVVIPTLLFYMLIVGLFHWALPALLPIGACVLIVNWKSFNLSKDEKISTALVAALGIGLFTWGMFQKPKVVQSVNLRPDAVQAVPGSQGTP